MNKIVILGRGNKYLFQTKNPQRFREFEICFCGNYSDYTLTTTIETNRENLTKKIAPFAPSPVLRASGLCGRENPMMITIEPILDFDLDEFVALIRSIGKPAQVNIGADTGSNRLPEPPKEKILELISELEKFTKVFCKKNIRRLVP